MCDHACFQPHVAALMSADTPQNVVGMSVVGPDFEKLKRFNIDELRQIPRTGEETSATRVKVDG